ncbi:MAG: response regulator transcription factor [Planctomycetes bacterium]|nr:response regulator transcription factor [Planctomycetota bacterium]
MAPQTTASNKAHKILIVDDHPVVRYGLSQVIAKQPDLVVCGEASSVGEALEQVESTAPDLAIVDISLEEENGLRLIEQIRGQYPAIKMLVSSVHNEAVYAPRALQAGAVGYIEKGQPMETIIDAIREILKGGIYLSPKMSQSMLHRAALGKPLHEDPVALLSNRELEVLDMIGQGLTINQIARQLQLSPKTIESHRTNIKDKLHLKNSVQLSRFAFDWVRDHR